jgi:dipeptidyl aminopeptidase/acylaminoacyl peptidase
MKRAPLALWLTACGGAPVTTNGRPAYAPEQLAEVVDITEIALSPDGRTLAFVTDRSGEPELWVVPAAGGEPRQLTSLHEQAQSPRFSPDGATIWFVSDRGGDERTDVFRVPVTGGEPARLRETPTAEWSPDVAPDGRTLAVSADPDTPFRFDAHLIDLATGEARRLTREAVNVVEPRFAPDGRVVAATRTGDDQKGDLLLIDAATGATRVLAPPVAGGILWPKAFSADGALLLCTGLNSQGFLQLVAVDVAAGTARFVGPSEWDVDDVAWDGTGPVLFARNEGGPSRLYALDGVDAAPRPIATPDGVITDLDVAGTTAAFLLESSTSPAAAFLLDPATGEARRLTPPGLGAVRSEDLAAAQGLTYTSEGHTIHALYLEPKVPRLGTPAPLVVWVHGGPNGQTRPYFSPPMQALAEAGFAVLAPDYRGSTGYGRAFEDANNMDWGGGDLRDLVAGVDHLAARGAIDPARVGVIGGSYGGYMTLRALTATPERWAAGVEMYGMPDLAHDYELTKDRFGDWYTTEMGTPQTHGDLFRDRSPIHALDRVRAPLLVLQGENDTNVPRAESDLVVERLRARGAAVDYVLYPEEGHGFSRRASRLDAMRRSVAFFERTLAPR